MERRRTGGMTAIAVLNIVLGGLEILNGLFQLLGSYILIFELWRQGALQSVFEIPVARPAFSLLLLATGVVGLIAGIGMLALHLWARPLSLVYGGLLIASAVFSFFTVPIIASIGTYDIGAISVDGLVRLIIFGLIDVLLPVPYAVVLWIVFFRPAWKATFTKGRTV